MRSNIITLLFSLLLSSLLYSCASEDLNLPEENEHFSFDVTVPGGELKTRGYSDGSLINELNCYVYQSSDNSLIRTVPIQLKTTDGKRGGSLGIDLPSGGTYSFVFLATACPQGNSGSKIYYNSGTKSLTVDYSKISTNDEDVDCFFGVLKDISIAKGDTHKVTLKRPFAQLNIGAKDLDDYNAMASSSLQRVGVTVDGVYSSMNVMTGEVTGDPAKATFAPFSFPSNQTFPSPDAKYLSMNYLLVNNRKNVDVTMTASNTSTSFDVDFSSVPVQRNYQTNIFGNLLTAQNDFKIEINPEFAGSGNKDVDDPWSEYDLVLTLTEPYSVTGRPNFTPHSAVRLITSEKTVDLQPYRSSDGMIKITWSEIGIKKSDFIQLDCSTIWDPEETYMIKSIIKCDINKLGVTSLNNFCTSNKLIEAPCTKDWDTSMVTDMGDLFSGCTKLTSLDLCSFDTGKVTDMSGMFKDCYALQDIDLSKFDTRLVTDMSEMFDKCYRFNILDLSNFDTSRVSNFSYMFIDCQNLKELNISSFDTRSVSDFSHMFENCIVLSNLDVSKFNTINATDMSGMFSCCYGLKALDVSNFDTRNVRDMSYMFNSCQFVDYIDVSNFDTRNVRDMNHMFSGCQTIKLLDISKFQTENVTDMNFMFCNCPNIEELDVSGFNTGKVTDMSHMFQTCGKITSLDLSNFNTSKVTDMWGMFYNCNMIRKLDLSSFDTRKVTQMGHMFAICSALEELLISNLNTEEVTTMYQMFYMCSALKNIDVSNFNTSKVTDMDGLFQDCKVLVDLDVSGFNTQNVKNMHAMFANCKQLTEIDTSRFETSNVNNMSAMFSGCIKIASLNLLSFNTSKVTDMSSMFKDCYALTELDLSSFDTSNAKTTDMFKNCSAQIKWS